MSSSWLSNTPSTQRTDPEVLPKASRRQFSAAAKLRILEAADRCTEPGQLGALLRRVLFKLTHNLLYTYVHFAVAE